MSSEVLVRSEIFKRRVNRDKDKFCGEIVTSTVARPVFRQVLLKYKKHYQPANASRGMKDTSEERVREPRKVVLFRQSMASIEDDDFRS